MNSGTLYIVGTPIGNLLDMAPRAVRILKEVHHIAAEDTRHTKKLLSYFSIHTPLSSYHKFNEKEKVQKFIDILSKGQNIALVSNAGMPGISDPGETLIRTAISAKINIVPVPGPTALVLALVASGILTDRFVFEGFLPRKKNIYMKRLYSLKGEERTIIFYESGKRLITTLTSMEKVMGERRIAIARELTKVYEEITRGNISDIKDILSLKPLKGEFVIVVEGAQPQDIVPAKSLKEEVEALQKEFSLTPKEAIKLVSARFNIQKRKVYEEYHRD